MPKMRLKEDRLLLNPKEMQSMRTRMDSKRKKENLQEEQGSILKDQST